MTTSRAFFALRRDLVSAAQVCALFPGTRPSLPPGSWVWIAVMPPAMAGAAVLKADVIIASIHLPEFYVGMIVSALTGWLVIGFLMRHLRVYGFGIFAIYCIILAVASIGILMSH